MEVCEESQSQNMKKCFVCYESNKPKTIAKCQDCSLTVHNKCYGITGKSFAQWKCRYCTYAEDQNLDIQKHNYTVKCRICNSKTFGALKPCALNNGFAHLICALWTPFTFVRNQYHMSPIHNIEKCIEYKSVLETLHCMVCAKNFATIKCRIKSCKYYYHPLCLIGTTDKHKNKCMIRQDFVIGKMPSAMFYVYCPKHAHLHQTFDSLQVQRNEREATFRRVKQEEPIPNNNDVEMSVSDNKMNEEWKNNMFDIDNMSDTNFLHSNAFDTELSPPFYNNMFDNNFMFRTPPMSKHAMSSIDSHSNMGNVQSPSQSQMLSNAPTPTVISNTNSSMSRMSTPSRSRAPVPFSNINEFEQIPYMHQPMHYSNYPMPMWNNPINSNSNNDNSDVFN